MPSRIDAQGNMIYKVEIKPEKATPGLHPPNPVKKDLVADTGSEITIIPFSNIASWFSTTGTLTMGPMQGGAGVGGGILIAELFGCIMTVEPVGDSNTGPFQQMECPNIWVFFGGDELEPGINGLLGMDQFDYLGVDR